jgi:hypothetical protein
VRWPRDVPRELFSSYGPDFQESSSSEVETGLPGRWLSLSSPTPPSWMEPQQGTSEVKEQPNQPPAFPVSCHHWDAGSHVRLFDGNTVLTLGSKSSCERVLLADTGDNLLRVSARAAPATAAANPRLMIRLVLEGEELVLDVDAEQRPMVMRRVGETDGERLAVPGSLGGVVLEAVGGWIFVEATGLGITLRWNAQVGLFHVAADDFFALK